MAKNLGRNLINNKIVKKWAFSEVRIGLLFVLDEMGNLIREEQPSKMLKEIPIGVYSDCFSTARVKNEEMIPYPFYDWIKVFSEETRELYFEQLHQFDVEIDDSHIHKIVSFHYETAFANLHAGKAQKASAPRPEGDVRDDRIDHIFEDKTS